MEEAVASSFRSEDGGNRPKNQIMYAKLHVQDDSKFYIHTPIMYGKKKQVALIMLIIALQFDVSTSFNM